MAKQQENLTYSPHVRGQCVPAFWARTGLFLLALSLMGGAYALTQRMPHAPMVEPSLTLPQYVPFTQVKMLGELEVSEAEAFRASLVAWREARKNRQKALYGREKTPVIKAERMPVEKIERAKPNLALKVVRVLLVNEAESFLQKVNLAHEIGSELFQKTP